MRKILRLGKAKKKATKYFGDRIYELKFIVFDFDGVFTDNKVWTSEEGTEFVSCSRYDGFGLQVLESLHIRTLVLSTEVNPVVSARCRKLKIECVQGCSDKISELERLIKDRGWRFDETAFVGNDINDIACLNAVGVAFIVKNSHPSLFKLDIPVLMTCHNGGDGAVREICDYIAEVKNVLGEKKRQTHEN